MGGRLLEPALRALHQARPCENKGLHVFILYLTACSCTLTLISNIKWFKVPVLMLAIPPTLQSKPILEIF